MVSQKKVEIVEDLTNQLRESSDLVFTNFKGLTVDQLETLRQELYEEDSRFRVVKNRLAQRAFRQAFDEGAPSQSGDDTEPSDQEPPADDSDRELADVTGLGPSKVEALEAEGIESVRDLAETSLEELTSVSGIGESTAEKFRGEARDMVDTEEPDETGDNPEEPAADEVAIDDGSLNTIDEVLTGNTAIALGGNGYVNMAEILVDFSEEHEALEIKGGLLNGGFLEPDEVESVSELPSRRELLTSLAGVLQKPIQTLVHNLQYPIQQLARTLNEVKESKESQS